MKTSTFAIIISLFLIPFLPNTAHAQIKVWVIWGQSMLSSGKPSQLGKKWRTIPANVEVYTGFNQQGLNKLTTFNKQKSIGPEVGFAIAISNMYPSDQHIVIRYSMGGTSMIDWSVNGELYFNLLEAITDAVNGRDVKYMAILSDQGETDSESLELTQEYQSRMTATMQGLRAALGNPDLPWFMGIDSSNNPIMPYSLQIAANQLSFVANGGGSVWGIEYSSLQHLPDRIELTTGGVVQLGQLMAYYVQLSGLCN
jgi:hypothetical protein